MATYVNDLRLKEIATGDESGTWGTSTNTNLELIGEALGYGTQEVFSSDADATTTIADGASDPARAMYFKITSGVSLTATRTCTIAPNTVSRVMFIENATSGSQSIAISQGSGANVTIAAGKTAVVYLDGAGATAAVVDAMAGVDPGVTDTLAEVLVAGNTSGGTGLTMSSGDDLTLTGASYNVVWDSSADSLTFADNAKAVFGAGSDLQIYHTPTGNHSIIAESGAGNLILAADNLEINNAANNANKIVASTGGAVTLYYNNSAKLATTATGVDITGTVTADGLTVDGTGAEVISVNSTANGSQIAFDSATTSSDWLVGIANDATDDFLIYQGGAGAGDIRLYTDGTERLTVLNGGNVGIGTATPSGLLNIHSASGDANLYVTTGNTAASTNIFFGDSGNSTIGRIVYDHNGDYMNFRTNGSDAMRIDSSGNVGIGTSTNLANGTLNVESNGTSVLQARSDTAGVNDGDTTVVVSRALNSTAGKWANAIYRGYSHAWSYGNSAATTEAMRIDSSGNVGIGESNPQTPLHISRDSASGENIALQIDNNDQTVGNEITMLFRSRVGATNTDFLIAGIANGANDMDLAFRSDGSTERMRITSDGNVGIGTDAIDLTSSGRTVVQIEGSSNALLNLTDGTSRLYLHQKGGTSGADIWNSANSYMRFATNDTEAMRIDASGNLLVGKTSASGSTVGGEIRATGAVLAVRDGDFAGYFNRKTSDGEIVRFVKDTTTVGSIGTQANDLNIGNADVALRFADDIDSIIPFSQTANADRGGAIDLGYPSAATKFRNLYLSGATTGSRFLAASTGVATPDYSFSADDTMGMYRVPGSLCFSTGGTERMRIDASGNLLVGKTSTGAATAGIELNGANDLLRIARNGGVLQELNRITNDGDIIEFRKDNTKVGSIGSEGGDSLFIVSEDTGFRFSGVLDAILPCTAAGAARDDVIDLGTGAARFDNIYATNGTIQTSDRKEKQDIEALSDAEQRVAVAAKGLLRKFRWKSAVAEKGDEARIHFGIIAQDLQDAFTAEGLDAGRYAMFINSTWTDEETGEERSRMGVRYSELLAFIIAAI